MDLVSILILSVFHLHLYALQHQPSQIYTGDYYETIPMQKIAPYKPLLYSGVFNVPRTYQHPVLELINIQFTTILIP